MKKRLVYLRYILPTVAVILVVAAAFLPCVSFELERNPLEARPLVSVMADAWSQCRQYLSDQMTTKDGATTSFVWRTIAGLAIAAVSAVVSVSLSVWATVRCVRILGCDPASPEATVLKEGLRRVFPGRVWICGAQLLIILPVLFPYWLSGAYSSALYLQTVAHSGLTWIAAGLICVSLLFVSLTRNIEKELRMDVFTIYTPEDGHADN